MPALGHRGGVVRLGAVVAALALVATACGGGDTDTMESPGSTSGSSPGTTHDRPLRRTARDGGLSITFTAERGRTAPDEAVGFVLRARRAEAPGALAYQVDYGDGTSDQIVVAQVCRGGEPEPGNETWQLSHRFARRGTYAVVATVSAGCTPDHATAELEVSVRGS